MKANRISFRTMAIAFILLPVMANSQSETKDSISYDGKFLKLEMVNVKSDKEGLLIQTKDKMILLNDSQMVIDTASAAHRELTTEEKLLLLNDTANKNRMVISGNEMSNDESHKDLVVSKMFVMDIGFNNMLNSNNEARMPDEYKDLKLNTSRSVNFHLGIVQQGVRLDPNGKLRLVYGLGIEYNNYHFERNVDLVGNQDELTYSLNEDVDYRKNKVVTQYATIPLMMHFKTNPANEEKSFNIALGVQAGYLFRTHIKQKWTEDGDREKRKKRSDYNFNELRYGYVAQIGYNSFNLYAKYYPTPVFRKDEGPEMNTVAFGIVLNAF